VNPGCSWRNVGIAGTPAMPGFANYKEMLDAVLTDVILNSRVA